MKADLVGQFNGTLSAPESFPGLCGSFDPGFSFSFRAHQRGDLVSCSLHLKAPGLAFPTPERLLADKESCLNRIRGATTPTVLTGSPTLIDLCARLAEPRLFSSDHEPEFPRRPFRFLLDSDLSVQIG